nr:hypothetical protein [Mycoplasmopsis bovis]
MNKWKLKNMQDIKAISIIYKNDNDNHIMRSLKMQKKKSEVPILKFHKLKLI